MKWFMHRRPVPRKSRYLWVTCRRQTDLLTMSRLFRSWSMEKLWAYALELYTSHHFYCNESATQLIQNDFFPVELYSKAHFLVTIKLMDIRFHQGLPFPSIKNKVFLSPQCTRTDDFVIKYAVQYFETKCRAEEFQPDEADGCRKERTEQEIPFTQAVKLVYGWLWDKYILNR